MMTRRFVPLLLIAGLGATQPALAQTAVEVHCPDKSVCREAKTGMPLKVLPRPFSNVYKGKQEDKDGIVQANVRAFYPLFVFARDDLDASVPNDPKGWYRVSESPQGQPIGWMRAKDVLEWRQALIVSYSHPGEGDEARSRVLMFDDRARLKAMVGSPDRAKGFSDAYASLKRQQIPAGVVSKEPERFVDITEKFYMLPIVDFELVNVDGDEARYLQLAAAVPGERSATDTLANPEFRQEAAQVGGSVQDMAALKALQVDLVFVMDMTSSMQTYLDRTKEAIAAIARGTGAAAGDRIRFGLVGYRDDLKTLPTLEFVSKNYTPQLVDAGQLVKILDTEAKAATVGSDDYPEEVFAGMKTALSTQWTENALRLVVLVGDASSHPVGHKQNTTGLDEKTLRIMADDAQVHVLALHLEEARATSDHPVASEQFTTLAKVRGTVGETGLIEIKVEHKDDFAGAVKAATDQVVRLIKKIEQDTGTVSGGAQAGTAGSGHADAQAPAGGQPLLDMPTTAAVPTPPALLDSPTAPASVAPSLKSAPTVAASPDDPAAQASHKMQKLIDTALVEYLGKDQTPPRDLLVWAFDRDPLNPATPALEVRVLLNKAQLSDLVTKLELVTKALKQAELTQMAFFDALSSVAAGTVKNPDQIKSADKLKGAGLLDAFIESLPYKSQILSLSNEMYAGMTPSERAALQNGLDAKLMLYRAVNEDVDGWVKLNESDTDADKVYPLSLDALP
jgi:hypothetical protein